MQFDFILKPVGGKCNLGCSYCYYLQRLPGKTVKASWSLDDARSVIDQIASLEKARNSKQARVTWHGGEPLLARIRWFRRVREFQSESGVDFINSIQTNGTLIDQRWIEVFKSMNTTVGISIDGPDFIHNKQRHTKKGRGVLDIVLRSIDLCRENKIRIGVLCVVTDESHQYIEDIINFFLEHGIKNFDFLPAYNTTFDQRCLSVSPENFSGFMKRAFDWYLDHDDPDIKIRTIVTVIERLLGGTGGVCTVSGKSCGRFLTIEGNGDVSFCDDYNADIFPILGNIKTTTLEEIIAGDMFKQSRSIAMGRVSDNPNCRNCQVKMLCNGGCQRNWIGETNYFCNYYKDFYQYVYFRLRTELAENIVESSIH